MGNSPLGNVSRRDVADKQTNGLGWLFRRTEPTTFLHFYQFKRQLRASSWTGHTVYVYIYKYTDRIVCIYCLRHCKICSRGWSMAMVATRPSSRTQRKHSTNRRGRTVRKKKGLTNNNHQTSTGKQAKFPPLPPSRNEVTPPFSFSVTATRFYPDTCLFDITVPV